MGSGRVSSYSSRAARRTAGSGSKKRSRSRTAATALHGRRPARGVLPLPIAHRFVVPLNASGPGIGAERAPGPLRDVAEVAEQHRLRPLLDRLAQRIEEGAKSVLLCHLGNIAQWTGRALRTDPRSGRIQGDDEAMGYWQREYAPGWAPAV